MTETHVPLLRSGLYEIAYLAGGPRRVVETAVVALVENGRLRVDRATGRLHVVDAHRRHPVEAVVLDAAGPRGRPVWGIVWRARSDPRPAVSPPPPPLPSSPADARAARYRHVPYDGGAVGAGGGWGGGFGGDC